MIGPDASVAGFAVSSSSASATSRIRSSRSSRPSFVFAETSANCVVAAPLLRLDAVRDELLAHLLRVRVVAVDLVHGDDHRHLGGAGVVDRLDRLRHDAVVGGDDQDGDVGDLRAAGAQRGERLVARRVEERDPAAGVVDLVGADVLRDPAGLGLDDGRLADRVEERRLAVVDVAHDRHDRRPRLEIVGVVLVDLRLELFLVGVLDRHLALELGRDQLDRLVGERLRDAHHLARAHQELHDLRDGLADRGRDVLDGRAGGDRDRSGRRRRGRPRRGRACGAGSALRAARVGARPVRPANR